MLTGHLVAGHPIIRALSRVLYQSQPVSGMSRYETWDLVIGAAGAIGMVVGIGLTIRQIRMLREESARGIELASRQHAMALVARYSEPAFSERARALRESADLQANYRECGYVLNLFEEIAIAVRHHTANEEILRDFYGTVLGQWLQKEYMTRTIENARSKNTKVYNSLIALYQRWQGQGSFLRIDALDRLAPPA